jgi:DNA modification methylase
MDIKIKDGKKFTDISNLKNWDLNPRSMTEKGFERLKKQIKKLGQHTPLIITEDGTVMSGNMRLKAMLDMGLKDIWVELIPKDKEKLAIEYALSANDRAGKYEADQLANLIGNFPDVEWGDFTVDTKDPELVSELMDKFSEVVEDEVPEVPKVAESKLGEVYELGRHRLMCGDSTDAGSVALLMNGHKADMVFTDPPYGMNLDADFDAMSKNSTKVKGNAYSNVIGDEVDFDPRPLMKLFDYCKEQLWWGADYYYDKLPPHGSWLIWAKRNENMLDIIGNHFEVCYSMNPRLRRIIYKNWSGVTARNPQFEREHPTEKPIALNADIIKERTTDNQLVVDLFGGSGSTLIACEQTNRICYMMELDPLYCDVIRNRYENFINRIKTAK